MTLGQRAVVRSHHQRDMREGRRSPAERLEDQQLPRCIGNVILASDHMRDLHQRIVDHDGVVVGGHAVRAHDHRIANHVSVEGDRAANDVIEADVAVIGNAKANDRRLTVLDAAPRLVAGQLATAPDVLRRPSCRQRRAPVGLEQVAPSRNSDTRVPPP